MYTVNISGACSDSSQLKPAYCEGSCVPKNIQRTLPLHVNSNHDTSYNNNIIS